MTGRSEITQAFRNLVNALSQGIKHLVKEAANLSSSTFDSVGAQDIVEVRAAQLCTALNCISFLTLEVRFSVRHSFYLACCGLCSPICRQSRAVAFEQGLRIRGFADAQRLPTYTTRSGPVSDKHH